jgi:hypothetical protein
MSVPYDMLIAAEFAARWLWEYVTKNKSVIKAKEET